MAGKKKKTQSPPPNRSSFHEGLKGFDIRISPFGEMESTFEIDQLNDFLNRQVMDRKIKQVDDTKQTT